VVCGGRNVVGLPFTQHLLANFDKEKFFYVILLKILTLFYVLIVFAVAMVILVPPK